MKLIIEKSLDGSVYCYREAERTFKLTEKERSNRSKKVDIKILDEECNLSWMEDNSYIVVNIKQ